MSTNTTLPLPFIFCPENRRLNAFSSKRNQVTERDEAGLSSKIPYWSFVYAEILLTLQRLGIPTPPYASLAVNT